jgi:glycosyltransferase involved in cell wall biosynthesis
MKLATVAFLNTVDLSHPTRIQGRAIANLDFYLALLARPELTQLDVYVCSPQDAQAVGTQLAARLGAKQLPEYVRLLLIDELPGALVNEGYAAFHQPDPLIDDVAWLRKRVGASLPIIGITHTLSDIRFIERLGALISAPIDERDAIICTSEAAELAFEKLLAQAAAKLGREVPSFERVRIPLGVTTIDEPMAREAARQRLGLPLDRTLVLSLGRVSTLTKMDLEPLFRVFESLLAREGQKLPQLLVAGALCDPYERQRLPQLLDELQLDVLRVDPLSEQDKPILYQACDVFVSMSDNPQESFGLTILEAMAAGLPVVATDWSAYRELIVDGQTGLLVPTLWADCLDSTSLLSPFLPPSQTAGRMAQSVAFDHRALRAHLLALCADEALRKTLGEAGRKRARQFRWPVIAERYMQLVEQLGSRSAASGRPRAREKIHSGGDRSEARLSLFEAFRHYATHLLSDAMTLELTARSRRVLEGQAPMSVAAPLSLLRQQEPLMPLMLRAIDSGAMVGQVRDLFERSAAKLSRDTTLLCVMWLIKQGFLAFPTDFSKGDPRDTVN